MAYRQLKKSHNKNEKFNIHQFCIFKRKMKEQQATKEELYKLDHLVSEYETIVASEKALLYLINEIAKEHNIPFKDVYGKYINRYNNEKKKLKEECYYPFENPVKTEHSYCKFSIIEGGKQ